MSLSAYVVAGIAGAAVLAGTFGIGYRYSEAQHAKAEVKVLQTDARELPKVEKKDEERKTLIKTVLIHAKQENPTDCFNQPVSEFALDQLRAGGVETGRAPNR